MNNGLNFTGVTLDDNGMAKDPELLRKFVAVMIAAQFDRQERSEDTYGSPPDGPFSERASATLRDNDSPRFDDGSTIPDDYYDGYTE
jgi:hypothetical protein